MNEKRCSACKQIKPAKAFNKCSANKNGLHGHCRECQRVNYAQWYANHVEENRARARAYGRREDVRQKHKERYHSDEEYRKKRRAQCTASRRKPKSMQKRLEWQRRKRKEEPQYKLKDNLRRRIRDVLMGKTKSASTMILVGCTTDELRGYIESQWLPGMTWENYGVHGWHLDHKTPCAAFDLSDPREQHLCFHYTNLQPLWAQDNWKKSDWVPGYQI